MPNTWFKFRQFTIHQDRCAMKVCTDACILGAWTASRLKTYQNILDIGAGTGLLSLMLAQQHHAVIDAIELDQEAAGQAVENIAASPWSDRIHLIHQDVRHYTFPHGYDFIISNPPFFENDLLSPSSGKNKAKHAETLNLEELMAIISRTLNTDGAFSMLVPFQRSAYAEKLAADNDYFLLEKMRIRQTPVHAPFRSILLFSGKESGLPVEQELTIRDEQGKETPELLDLMKDYYLR